VSKEFPPFVSGGGIGTLYYHLASELLLMGHHVTVVVPGDIAETYRQGRLIIRYQPLHHICEDTVGAPAFIRNINWGISALHAVAEIHNEQSIDVVDSALWDSESLAIALIERTKRPPLVLRLVTPFRVASRLNDWAISKHEMEFFEASERAVIANADGVVPISQSISGTIQSEYEVVQDARWVICHCGIAYWPSFDVWTGYTELKVVNGKPLSFAISAKIILFLGRLERRKGVDLLLAAANEILSCDRHAHLVLAGKDTEGWSNSIQGFEKDISERVHFVGEVEDGTREKLLNAAYCVVFPSRYESFGLVPLEAFVHGTPVVATNAGAIPEVVEEGKSGLLFHPEDSAALAKCVTRLLLDQKLRERLSSGARQRIRHFSSRRSAIRAISLYESLVSRGLSRGGRQFSVLKNTVYGGNAGYSVSYHGSHRRMLTKCGRRQGRSMESTGSEGFLLYGPYVELQPGTYKAQLFGTVGSAGTPSAFADVLVGAGHLPTRPQRLTQAKIDGHLLSVGFRIQATSQVEVRVWVPADAEVSIRKVVIFSVESCSL
jgi:glycosyltransferase involved in cell wall biosynthesis